MGSREESEIAAFFVFSNIRIKGYFRLGKVYECPAWLEPPAGARNRRKHEKKATSASLLDPNYVHKLHSIENLYRNLNNKIWKVGGEERDRFRIRE